MKSSSK